MSTDPAAEPTTDPAADVETPAAPLSWRSCITVLLGIVLFMGVVSVIAALDQQRRSDRAAAAETKYAVRFIKAIRDGEGGGLWRFPDGRTEVCRISGEADDPTLRCGADLTEPEVFGNDFLPHTSRA